MFAPVVGSGGQQRQRRRARTGCSSHGRRNDKVAPAPPSSGELDGLHNLAVTSLFSSEFRVWFNRGLHENSLFVFFGLLIDQCLFFLASA